MKKITIIIVLMIVSASSLATTGTDFETVFHKTARSICHYTGYSHQLIDRSIKFNNGYRIEVHLYSLDCEGAAWGNIRQMQCMATVGKNGVPVYTCQ